MRELKAPVSLALRLCLGALWSFIPSGFAKLLARAGDEAKIGFKVHPHMLRHACGYALANKGIDTRTLQAYLGTLDQLDHALCGVGPGAVQKH